MTIRTTLTDTTRKARMGLSRATIRSVSDDHLMQQVNHADVFHSETPSDFERWQMVGMTSVPIDQQEDPDAKQPQKQPTEEQISEDGDWNHDQPKGPAAEAVMLYLNGSRSHPVAIVDDRRVRPYGMSPGEGAHYAPDGSEQMVLFKPNGTYVVSLDGKSVADNKNKQTRFASLRHVNKSMQTHKIDSSQNSSQQSTTGAQTREGSTSGSSQGQKQKYKHEGDSVNSEVRNTKDTIEFYAPGDKMVGSYDKSKKRWLLDVDGAGTCTFEMLADKITIKMGSSSIEITSGNIKLTSPRIDHN